MIEDRHEGFLQGVLVAPAPRVAIVLGKLLGGTTMALLQATVFLALAPLANTEIRWDMLPALGLVLFLLAFGLTGLGFALAWIIDSTQGFHAIMNVVLFPMWLLSGAVFPASGAAGWVQAVMLVNPLTYGVSALRLVLEAPAATASGALAAPVGLILLFGLLMLGLCSWSVGRRPA